MLLLFLLVKSWPGPRCVCNVLPTASTHCYVYKNRSGISVMKSHDVRWFLILLPLCVSGRFLVQFKQDKVCVKFIQGGPKNGNSAACKRKNNRLLEVSVPSP